MQIEDVFGSWAAARSVRAASWAASSERIELVGLRETARAS
jgi:hypothetical protein